MAWVVDTCVVIDVGEDDPEFGERSARVLDRHIREGLVLSPVTTIELAPAFGGDRAALRTFLRHLGVRASEPWLDEDTAAAFDGWWRYLAARRSRRVAKRPIADILIGGFACRFRGLITRNPADFAPWFPRLRVVDPTQS
jgi:predicted nucleic acid-binding protein